MRMHHGLALIVALSVITFVGLVWFQLNHVEESQSKEDRSSSASLRWSLTRNVEDQLARTVQRLESDTQNTEIVAEENNPHAVNDDGDLPKKRSKDIAIEDVGSRESVAYPEQRTGPDNSEQQARPKTDLIVERARHVLQKDAVVERLLGQCKQWNKPLAERFAAECGFWIDRVTRWDMQPKVKEVGYLCSQDEFCTGWGDRVGGISSVFYKALTENGSFHIGMDGLPGLISPCLFTEQSWSFKELAWNNTCKGKFNDCDNWRTMKCTSPNQDVLAYNLDRACTPPDLCDELERRQIQQGSGPGLVANVLGCALRSLIEPSEEVWSLTKYPLKNGNEPAREMSLAAMDELFNKYYIIGIHIRVGDVDAFFTKNSDPTLRTRGSKKKQPWDAFSGQEVDLRALSGPVQNASAEKQLKPHFLYPFRCAATIESSLLGNNGMSTDDTSEIYASDGRPVRWFLSTDSNPLKLAARKLFPGRLITVDLPPRHVSLSYDLNQKETLRQTMVEWYLIGRGDELIVNKLLESNPGMIENDFLFGRVSGFSKTSRAYHLRSDLYDAATCVRSLLPQKGTWKFTGCPHQRKTRQQQVFPQPHLAPLEKAGLAFPRSWISRGVIQAPRMNHGPQFGRTADFDDEDDGDVDASKGAFHQLNWKIYHATQWAKNSPQERQRNRDLWAEPDESDIEAIQSAMRALSQPPSTSNTARSIADHRLCAPRECSSPKSFLTEDRPRPKGYVYLASFPGSGNTWLRRVIEDGTRVFTGSDYDDLELKESGFAGEGPRILYETSTPRVAVVKTHYPLYETSPHPNITSMIVLVRCPFDAVYAEFNRQYSLGHTKVASIEDRRANFPTFFRAHYPQWIKTMRYFLRRKFWETPLWTRWQDNSSSNVASPVVPVRLTPFSFDPRLGDRLPPDLSVPGLILIYEDLVRDFERTVAGLFAFLEQRLGRSIPVTARDAQACALLEYVANPRRGKRRSQQSEANEAMYNPYLDPESDLVRRPFQIEMFCADAEAYWLEDKWGPCREGPYLQNQRHVALGEQSKEESLRNSLHRFAERYCK